MEREICEELRKRVTYMYCLQEVRWRGQDSSMLEKERHLSCSGQEMELVV